MDKNCDECVFYKQPKSTGSLCGVCDYPVPEWIKTGASGGGFIGSPEYTGLDCATFKSRADIVNSEK